MIDRFGDVLPKFRKATGRTRILTDGQLEKLLQMRAEGARLRECAKAFDVHIATICRYLTPALKQKLEKMRADRLGTSRTN